METSMNYMVKFSIDCEFHGKRGTPNVYLTFRTQPESSLNNTFKPDVFSHTSKSVEGCEVSLVDFKLRKQVYSYNTLDFTLSVKTGENNVVYKQAVEDANYILKGGVVRIELNSSDHEDVAKQYVIERIAVEGMQDMASFTLYCTAYSPDYFLTLDKFCKVYTGSRLLDIVDMELGYVKKDDKGGVYLHQEKLDWTEPEWEDNNKKIGRKPEEFFEIISASDRMPYLVQYNESFYSFLRRVCYRCGEYLFYDQGKLHIGRKKMDKNTRELKKPGYSERFEFPNASPSGLSGGAPEVWSKDYRMFKSSEWQTSEKRDYYDDMAVPEAAKNDDTENNTRAGGKGTVRILAEKKFWTESIPKALLTHLPDVLNDVISPYNTTDFIISAFLSAAVNPISDAFIEAMAAGNVEEERPNVNVTFSGDQFMEAGFFVKLQRKMQNVHKSSFCLQYHNSIYNVYLGEIVSCERDFMTEGKYVVNEVEFSFNRPESQGRFDYKVKLVPLYKEKVKDAQGTETETEIPLPDFHEEIPLVVTSGPQAAVVWTSDDKFVTSVDPENMGRVRIRYPWQYYDAKFGAAPSPLRRMTSPMKTGSRGFSFIPRKGDFVMVGYEGNNMERPYIIGALPNNSENAKPGFTDSKRGWSYNNDAAHGLTNSISSPNGHSIVFNDTSKGALSGLIGSLAGGIAGSAISSIPGLKEAAGSNWPGGGITFRDNVGTYCISMSASNRQISIKSPLGDISLNALTGISINAPKGDITIKGMNITLEAGNNLIMKSSVALDSVIADEKKRNPHKYAAAIGKIIKYVVIDFKMTRFIMGLAYKPIEGTVSISSLGNIFLVQGKNPMVFNDCVETENDAINPKSHVEKCYTRLTKAYAWVSGSIDNIYINYVDTRRQVENIYELLTEFNDKFCGDAGSLKPLPKDFLNVGNKKISDAGYNCFTEEGELNDDLYIKLGDMRGKYSDPEKFENYFDNQEIRVGDKIADEIMYAADKILDNCRPTPNAPMKKRDEFINVFKQIDGMDFLNDYKPKITACWSNAFGIGAENDADATLKALYAECLKKECNNAELKKAGVSLRSLRAIPLVGKKINTARLGRGNWKLGNWKHKVIQNMFYENYKKNGDDDGKFGCEYAFTQEDLASLSDKPWKVFCTKYIEIIMKGKPEKQGFGWELLRSIAPEIMTDIVDVKSKNNIGKSIALGIAPKANETKNYKPGIFISGADNAIYRYNNAGEFERAPHSSLATYNDLYRLLLSFDD